MKISLTNHKTSVTIEKEEESIEVLIDSFISCMVILDFEPQEIKKEIIKAAEILKNNHEPSKNFSPI